MKTIVPKSIKQIAISHPDFPEFERKMKEVYGADWELVTYDELAKGERQVIQRLRQALE